MKTKNFTPPRSLRIAAILAAVMLMAMTVQTARAAQQDNWTYTDYGTYSIITAYTGSDKTTLTSLNFPKQLGGKEVMGIAYNFYFSEFTNLQTLNFYQNAQIDEMPSVMGCSKLAHINVILDNGSIYETDELPLAIKTIPGNCFKGTAIGTISFGGVTSVRSNVFKDSNSLYWVEFNQGASIDDGAFSYIQSSCTIDYTSSRSDWTWQKIAFSPNLYVTCNDGAIGWCGDGNNTAQDFLYWTMDASRNLTIACAGDGWYNFQDKQIIKSHRWNDWVAILYADVRSITLSQVYALSANEFKGMTGVTSVTLNDGLTSIGASAFEGCTGLTSITIPASVTSIGVDAFKGCTSLTTVTIAGNPAIADGAFPAGATVRMNLTANGPVGSDYWMTFYNDGYNFQADASTTVYKATVSGGSLVLHEVADRIVTAGKAVILKSTAEHPVMTKVSSASADGYADGTNDLVGVMTATATPANCYTLGNGSAGVGFYHYTGTNVHAGKAYLIHSGAGARTFYGFGGGDATGVTPSLEVEGEGSAQWYSLDGRRLDGQPTQKGVYVNGGRKVVVK